LYKRLVGYARYTLLAGRWSDQYWRPTDRQRHSAPSITHSLESSTCRSRRPPSMRSRICVTVGCPSVRPSRRSTAATAAGGFAAERPAIRRYRLLAAGAMQLPTYADNVVLPTFARRVPMMRQQIHISCPPGPTAANCSSGFAAVGPCWDRQTDRCIHAVARSILAVPIEQHVAVVISQLLSATANVSAIDC